MKSSILNRVTSVIIVVLSIFFTFSKVYSCDPIGCILAGNDLSIIGEVIESGKSFSAMKVKIIFVFPGEKNSLVKVGNEIIVGDIVSRNPWPLYEEGVFVGKTFFMSLKTYEDKFFLGPYMSEVILNGKYFDFVNIKNADDAALQIFINSGGKENNFYFIEDKGFIRNDDGSSIQIYPYTDPRPDGSQNTYDKLWFRLFVSSSPLGQETINTINYNGLSLIFIPLIAIIIPILSIIKVFPRVKNNSLFITLIIIIAVLYLYYLLGILPYQFAMI